MFFDVETSMDVKGMFDKANNVQSISKNNFSTLIMSTFWGTSSGSCSNYPKIVICVI